MASRINMMDGMAESARVSAREIAAWVGVNETTIWRWAKAGILPPPQRISARCTRWELGLVRKALAKAGA